MGNEGTLRIRVLGDVADFQNKMQSVGGDLEKLGGKISSAGSTLTKGLTLPILAAGGAALKLASDAEESNARLSSAFTSMGADSWTSLDKLQGKAEELMSRTTFDDEAIKDAQAVMLTFGNVTGDAFDGGIEAALNMSTALGTDLQGSVVMLGKALNDPVKGITAMTRAGVSFTEQQKDQIKAMVAAGDTAGAQKLILEELEKQFGGMAENMAKTSKGQMQQAFNELAEAGEDIGKLLLPVLQDVAKHVRGLATWFQNLSPETKALIVQIAGLLAVIGPLLLVVGKLTTGLGAMFKVIGGGAGFVVTLLTKLGLMTGAITADTAATTANTTAKNLNAKALLGVGAGAAAVGGGLILINEALNHSSGELQKFTGMVGAMSEEERRATADTEVFGVKTGELTGHFANFLSTVAPWHSVAQDAREANDALNGVIDEQAAALGRASEAARVQAAVMEQVALAQGAATESVANATRLGAARVHDEWQNMSLGIVNTMERTTREVGEVGREMVRNFVGNVRGQKGFVDDVMGELTWAINHPMAMTKRIAEIEGALTGKALGRALQSTDPYIRGVAEQQQQILITRWEELTGKAWTHGENSGEAYGRGNKSGVNNTAPAAVDAVRTGILNKANNLPWESGGNAAGADWIRAFGGAISAREQGIINKLRHLSRMFIGESPPPEGPLKDLDKGGYKAGRSWFSGLQAGIGGDLTHSLRRVGRQFSQPLGPSYTSALTPAFAGGATLGGGRVINVGGITINAPSGNADDIAAKVRRVFDDLIAGDMRSTDAYTANVG